jgi:endoglucanase
MNKKALSILVLLLICSGIGFTVGAYSRRFIDFTFTTGDVDELNQGFDEIDQVLSSFNNKINQLENRLNKYESEFVQVGIYPSGGVNIWDYENELNVKFDHILQYQKVKNIDYTKIVRFLDLNYDVVLNLEFQDTYANLQDITNGVYDSYLISLAHDIKADGRTIWLRPLHEFNGNWYNWGTLYSGNSIDDFVPAWKHVVQLFRDQDAPVKFQLNYNRYNGKGDTTSFSAFWPGDDYVDMVVITSYNRAYTDEWHQYWSTFSEDFENAYNQVVSLTNKQIGIAEMSSTSYGGDKPQWIINAFNSIAYDYPQVQQVTWFLTNRPVSDLIWDWDLNTQEEKDAFIQGMEIIDNIRR